MLDTWITLTKRYSERLIKEYGYPAANIRTNVPFSRGKARYELDIVVYIKGQPYIVAEVKTKIEDKTAIEQLIKYSSIGNQFAVLTDGFSDICFQVSRDNLKVQLNKIPDIPNFEQCLDDIGKQRYSELVDVDPQRFKAVISRLLDYLRAEIGSPLEALKVLSLIMLAKLYDERNRSELFRFSYQESKKDVEARLHQLIASVSSQHPNLNTDLWVKAETLALIVSRIQKFRLSGLSERHNLSILLENGFQELYGENYTPRAVNQLIVGLLSLARGKELVDPACGLGGLIYEAAQKGVKVVGYENNVDVGTIAQTNLLLSNLVGEIQVKDSLQDPKPDKEFDYVAVVPPFGGIIKDTRLSSFRLGRLKKSQNREDLFIELSLSLAKPNGRIAIVVPNRVLFSYSSKETRLLINKESTIKAILELPDTAFAPYSRVKTSLLILEKLDKQNPSQQGKVFVSCLENFDEILETVESFSRFETSAKFQENENMFVLNVEKAEHLDVTYLKGLRFLKTLDKIDTLELGKIADITAGTSMKRVGVVSKDGNIPYLKGGNVLEWAIDKENAEKIRAVENISRWIAVPNDILMTRAGTVGRAAIVPDDAPEMIIGTNLVRIRVRAQAPILPEYALAYLKSRQGKRQIAMFSGGSAIKSINVNGLGKVRIPLIPIKKQKEIAQEFKKIVEAINEAENLLMESRNELMKFSNDLGNRIVENK